MLKKALFICFIFFNFSLLQGEESFGQATNEWENIKGKEIFIFVNNKNKSKEKPDGSKKAPFKTIEEAFTHLSGLKGKDLKATIYITGSFRSKNVYVITCPTKIMGFEFYDNIATEKKASSISFEKNAGFVVTASTLFMEKCTISRREFVGEPRSVPILYSSNSTINLKNITITAKEGGTLFRFIESSVSIDAMILNSNQNGYCNIIETSASEIKIKNTHLNCNGRFVIALDSNDSSLNIEGLHCNIKAYLFAIGMKANNGKVNIKNSFFGVEGKYVWADEAILYSNEEAILNIKNLKLKGFMKEKKLQKD